MSVSQEHMLNFPITLALGSPLNWGNRLFGQLRIRSRPRIASFCQSSQHDPSMLSQSFCPTFINS